MKRKCLNCKDSREHTIEDRPYLYCERQGAFKTLWDRCNLECEKLENCPNCSKPLHEDGYCAYCEFSKEKRVIYEFPDEV